MSRTRLAPLVILLAVGCTKPETETDPKRAAEPAKADSGEAEAGAVKTESGTTGTAEPASATETDTETDDEETGEPAPLPDHFDEIGVAVCDQYVTDFQACIDTLPEADRDAHRRTLADNHASWLQTKKGGDSAAAGLQIGCRGAREQAKAATTAQGCTW
jgi:hypothetical protein